jgi:hypothetical protein
MRARVGSSPVVGALVLALAVALVLALGTGPAGAQQAPTLGAPPAPNVTVQPQSTSTSSGNGGLKPWQEALIVAAGIILIGGIALAILADSRDRARRIGHGRAATEPGEAPHRHKQRSKQQARSKGKAARAARRRNR